MEVQESERERYSEMDKWYIEHVMRDLKKKKLYSAEDYLRKNLEHLKAEHEHWFNIMQHGCDDPFWSDGVNMNLTRNHILFYKNVILATCVVCNIPVPAEYYIPTPPEVDDLYMADIRSNIERRKELAKKKRIGKFEFRKPNMNTSQLTFL